jgi:RNA polymerase sigma-70 factor (ECF subfamily)
MTDAADPQKQRDEARWAALMVRAQQGHELEYRQLLGELAEAVHRYLLSRFGHHHFLEDCVQDILVAVHQARHTYDPQRRFRPWLFAIVRHKAIDTLRRQRSHQDALDRHREERLTETRNSDQQILEDGMTRGRLLEALSPQYREAITLTKLDGLSVAEAAARLSVSQGTLKVRVHRAIGRLRRLIEAEQP